MDGWERKVSFKCVDFGCSISFVLNFKQIKLANYVNMKHKHEVQIEFFCGGKENEGGGGEGVKHFRSFEKIINLSSSFLKINQSKYKQFSKCPTPFCASPTKEEFEA